MAKRVYFSRLFEVDDFCVNLKDLMPLPTSALDVSSIRRLIDLFDFCLTQCLNRRRGWGVEPPTVFSTP